MQLVEVRRQGKTRVLTSVDKLGAVFTQVNGQRLKPAYSIGPEGAKTRAVMFSCPVAAVPDAVWAVLALWNSCRLTKTLPRAGGLLDQPMVVQRGFPVLDVEFQKAGGNSRELAHAMSLALMGGKA